MDSLIEKLEAVDMGSRELDCEIARRLGWTYEKRSRETKPWWRKPGASDFARSSDQYWTVYPRMQWTTSIDDAMTLVSDGREWGVGVDLENGRGWAIVGDKCWDECFDNDCIVASRPALALCIAALRAMEADHA